MKPSTLFADTEDIVAMSRSRCYSELIQLPSFEERYRYLRILGSVGTETFGFDRYLNQRFYHSAEWRSIRDYIIARDNGRDLGIEGREIFGKIYIHHMNPILIKDLILVRDILIDPEYLICTSHETHNAIHYGSEELLSRDPLIRRPNDTCPWKRS